MECAKKSIYCTAEYTRSRYIIDLRLDISQIVDFDPFIYSKLPIYGIDRYASPTLLSIVVERR